MSLEIVDLYSFNQDYVQNLNKLFINQNDLSKKCNQQLMSYKDILIRNGHRQEKIKTDFNEYLKLLNRRIFQIDFFKNYTTINLFVHEKGNNFADRYEIDRHGKKTNVGLNHQEMLISDFNSLFQSIKKSKNKSFGQANLKGANFNIIGTFLSHEFVVENFSVIFIISRNEFLPQETDDISLFNQYRPFIKNSFYMFATTVYQARQINNINLVANLLLPNLTQDNNLKKIKEKKIFILNNKFYSYDERVQKDLSAIHFHNEKILLLGDLLNTLRHELSNPLFGIKLNSELLKLESNCPEHTDIFDNIIFAENRCANILQTFTSLFNSNNFASTDLARSIKEVMTILKAEVKNIKINLIFNSATPFVAKINPAISMQIFFNLLLNSIQAINDNNILSPCIDINLKNDHNFIVIDLIDNGPGIKENNQDIIFKKFYTTKKLGTGLGLSITKTLLEINGGTIDLIKVPENNGAHFNIKIPLDHI